MDKQDPTPRRRPTGRYAFSDPDWRVSPDDHRTAEELLHDLWSHLGDWGKHLAPGSLGILTPKAILVLAMHAAHQPTVRYRDEHGRVCVERGLIWNIVGDEIQMMCPANTPGAHRVSFPITAVESIELTPADGLVKDDKYVNQTPASDG